MELPWLMRKAQEHLEMLCNEIPNRRMRIDSEKIVTTALALHELLISF